MTTVGKNLKITVAKQHRALTRQMFTEAFGCVMKSPSETMDVFIFEDGYSLGAAFVEAADALAPADQRKAPWLEILVADPEAAASELRKLGIEPFEYQDKAHSYFSPPSGPVFRLARRT
jgi:hypothetical protein